MYTEDNRAINDQGTSASFWNKHYILLCIRGLFQSAMVAERDFNDLKDVVESLRQDKEMHDTNIEALEIRVKKVDEWKIDFGDALEAKIANIELEANKAQGHLNAIVT